MKSRHHSREIALQILYQQDLTQSANSDTQMLESQQVQTQLKNHFFHFRVPESLQGFISELVLGTLAHLAEIDTLLEQQATHWKVTRMSSVDRSILRMAVYEMRYLQKTPASIVMNEAIELAKQFGTVETASFTNGILDQLKL